MFEKQSPAFDVTFVFMLFCIVYAGRAALTFGNNKTSRQYFFGGLQRNCRPLIPKNHLK